MQKISVFSKNSKLNSMTHFCTAYHQIVQKKATTNECSEAMNCFGCFRFTAAELINISASAPN